MQRLGFGTTDMGNLHVTTGSTTPYAFCPPTSGEHYNGPPGQGPIRRDFYEQGSQPRPGGWVHNLEHGWVVLSYRTGPDEPNAEELVEMQRFFDEAPPATSCTQVPNKALVLPFADQTTRFALLAWDRALLTDTFDLDEALAFYQQQVDNAQAPEEGVC